MGKLSRVSTDSLSHLFWKKSEFRRCRWSVKYSLILLVIIAYRIPTARNLSSTWDDLQSRGLVSIDENGFPLMPYVALYCLLQSTSNENLRNAAKGLLFDDKKFFFWQSFEEFHIEYRIFLETILYEYKLLNGLPLIASIQELYPGAKISTSKDFIIKICAPKFLHRRNRFPTTDPLYDFHETCLNASGAAFDGFSVRNTDPSGSIILVDQLKFTRGTRRTTSYTFLDEYTKSRDAVRLAGFEESWIFGLFTPGEVEIPEGIQDTVVVDRNKFQEFYSILSRRAQFSAGNFVFSFTFLFIFLFNYI